MSISRYSFVAVLLIVNSLSVYGQTIEEAVEAMPVPPNTQDISDRLCIKSSIGAGFDKSLPAADVNHYKNSQLPKVFVAWGRKHFAGGRSELDCPDVDTSLLVTRMNMFLSNDASPFFKAAGLKILFEAEAKAVERSKQAARTAGAEAASVASARDPALAATVVQALTSSLSESSEDALAGKPEAAERIDQSLKQAIDGYALGWYLFGSNWVETPREQKREAYELLVKFLRKTILAAYSVSPVADRRKATVGSPVLNELQMPAATSQTRGPNILCRPLQMRNDCHSVSLAVRLSNSSNPIEITYELMPVRDSEYRIVEVNIVGIGVISTLAAQFRTKSVEAAVLQLRIAVNRKKE